MLPFGITELSLMRANDYAARLLPVATSPTFVFLCGAALEVNVRICRSECNDRPPFSLRGSGPQVILSAWRGPTGQLLARVGFAGTPETKSSPRCTQLASASSAA